jgi:hypothetical protein
MASLEFQSKIPAPEQRVGNEPERRNGTEESGLDQTIMKADDGVQTVQLQSLFDAKDENAKYESERIVVPLMLCQDRKRLTNGQRLQSSRSG